MSQRYAINDLIKRGATWQMIVAGLFAASICGCGKQSTPSMAGSASPKAAVHTAEQNGLVPSSEALTPSRIPVDQSENTPLSVAELIILAGSPCETVLQSAHCMSKESDFEFIPDCATHGYYAAVKNSSGADVLSQVPPQNNIIRSVLSHGQLVCVQAVARIKTYPSYLFVTSVPNAENDCLGCKEYGSRKIEWRVQHAHGTCVQTARGRYVGDCAVGWVDGDDMKLLGNLK